jgi:hypothetical protein
LTLVDAARVLKATVAAVRKRAKRGSLQASRDNQGRLLVWVDSGVDAGAYGVPVQSGRGVPGGQVVPDSVIVELRLKIQDRDREIDRLRADLQSERQRHDAEIERLVGQIHAERAFWTERADAAELRAEGAEQRAAEVNRMLHDLVQRIMALPAGEAAPAARPWWARWFR